MFYPVCHYPHMAGLKAGLPHKHTGSYTVFFDTLSVFNHAQTTAYSWEGRMIENVTLEVNSVLGLCKT